jgi:hypothetical protein
MNTGKELYKLVQYDAGSLIKLTFLIDCYVFNLLFIARNDVRSDSLLSL